MIPTLTHNPYPRVAGLKGTKARGLAYERKVGRVLAALADECGFTLYDHPWLAGPCQPDYVLESASGACLVVETKLTQVDCTAQLAKYRAALAPRSVVGVQVCRRLMSGSTVKCFEDVLDGDVLLFWS